MKKLLLFLILPITLFSQNKAINASTQWIEENGADMINEYAQFLKLPNHASNIIDINKNAEFLKNGFSKRGFEMQLLKLPDAPPIVYGERKVPGAKRTYCFYIHYDGQPVDPKAWTHEPFNPTLYDNAMNKGGEKIDFPKSGEKIGKEWRVYARSASDDKAPFLTLWSAIDALNNSDIPFSSNIKLFFDGEEESSSPNVMKYLEKYSELFDDIDVWLLNDGAIFQTGQPQFKFGGRGVTSLELTVFGANASLHSGHYGNWAPVPGQMLARLLTSMKSEDGTVLIDGFYDSVIPISEYEREQINNIPNIDKYLKRELGLSFTEGNNQNLFERVLMPSLTIRGLSSGNVGEKSRNVIPSKATATLGMRLVKGNDPEKMIDLVEKHIKSQGWHITYKDPDEKTRNLYPKIVKVKRNPNGFPAGKINMDDPTVRPIIEAVKKHINPNIVLLSSSGGSNRIYQIIWEVLDKPGISVNMVNHDNNQHAADENLRLGNLWYGINLMALLLTME